MGGRQPSQRSSRSSPSVISSALPAKERRTNSLPRRVSKSMPGRGGHAGLVEQAQAPGVGVVGEVADVGVHVEGAVGRAPAGRCRAGAGRRAAAPRLAA